MRSKIVLSAMMRFQIVLCKTRTRPLPKAGSANNLVGNFERLHGTTSVFDLFE
jgi:hypothetical protein